MPPSYIPNKEKGRGKVKMSETDAQPGANQRNLEFHQEEKGCGDGDEDTEQLDLVATSFRRKHAKQVTTTTHLYEFRELQRSHGQD